MSQQCPISQQPYPEQSNATTTLVLGILGLVLCWVVAPIAWSMGNSELRCIEERRRDPSNRSTANTGRILGIIGTVLLAIAGQEVSRTFSEISSGLDA